MKIKEEFMRKKREVFELLRKSGSLTPEIERRLIELYGQRGRKAISMVKGGRVKKSGDVWIVEGGTDVYELAGNFCYCFDFALNVVTGKANVDACYHILAKQICEVLDESGKNKE